MKKKVLLVTLLVVAIVASCLAFTACNKKGDDKGDGSKMKVAMITDYGDITDQSFNQTTYEASKAFCEANGLSFKYYKPAGDNTEARVASVECPVYNYAEYKRDKETVTVEPKRIIILEGLFLFENPALSNLIDIKVFVDTDADVRILRRIIRDVKERGRSLDSVVLQYLTTVKPMHERFIEPEKKRADIIVPEGGYNEVAFDMIVDAIKHKLN